MDPSQDQGTPEQRRPDAPPPAGPLRAASRCRTPRSSGRSRWPIPSIAGYNGSSSARNALAYAAGMARRLDRPLLIVYVTSPGVYCEPMTGQVVGLLRDADSLERWLLAELDQAADSGGLEVHVRTRRGSPARELASIAAEFSADALVIGAPGPLLAPPGRLGPQLASPPRPLPRNSRPLTARTRTFRPPARREREPTDPRGTTVRSTYGS